jgi:hypothetical protein
MAKFDHYFSPANRLAVTYFIDAMSLDSAPFAFGGSNVPGFGADTTQRFQHVVLRDTHTFSPSLLNESRASYHRNASDGNMPQNRTKMSDLGLHGIVPDEPDGEGPPWVIITGFSEFGNTIQGPQGRADNTFQYIDNVSWTRGRHAKFGGEFRVRLTDVPFINNGTCYRRQRNAARQGSADSRPQPAVTGKSAAVFHANAGCDGNTTQPKEP